MVKKLNEHIFQLKFKYNTREAIRIAWFADIHFDSHYTNRKLLKQHLNKCLETNTYIILGGDLLDLMQGKNDPRSNKTELKNKYNSNDYINKIINDITNFLQPYKHLILLILKGNHDLKYTEKYGIDTIDLIGDKLNIKTGSYSNYIRLNFELGSGKGGYKSFLIYHSHSSGSIGMRSKGTLAIDILAGKYPDADIYVTEHSHSSFIIPISVERLDRFNKIKYETKYFLQVPSYEESWKDNRNNWWNQTNKGPRPIGHYLMEFNYNRDDKIRYNINFVE